MTPLSNSSGHRTGRLVLLRDITERKRGEEEIQVVNEHLRTKLAEIESLQSNLREQAIRDSLTGLFNRRYLDEALGLELKRAEHEKLAVSVLMVDIDHFKELNDLHGHGAGDQILAVLGSLLTRHVRSSDFACRYGGDEFIVVMPGVSNLVAYQRAEIIRAQFEESDIDFDGICLRSTFSAGVAHYPQQGKTVDGLLRVVDQALYQAKQAGRNQVAMLTDGSRSD